MCKSPCHISTWEPCRSHTIFALCVSLLFTYQLLYLVEWHDRDPRQRCPLGNEKSAPKSCSAWKLGKGPSKTKGRIRHQSQMRCGSPWCPHPKDKLHVWEGGRETSSRWGTSSLLLLPAAARYWEGTVSAWLDSKNNTEELVQVWESSIYSNSGK